MNNPQMIINCCDFYCHHDLSTDYLQSSVLDGPACLSNYMTANEAIVIIILVFQMTNWGLEK